MFGYGYGYGGYYGFDWTLLLLIPKTEFFAALFLSKPQYFKHSVLKLRLVYPDASSCRFIAVNHDIISISFGAYGIFVAFNWLTGFILYKKKIYIKI